MTIVPSDVGSEAQAVLAAPGRVSHVLVVSIRPGAEAVVRGLACALPLLVRAVGARAPDAELACVIGFSYDGWLRVAGRTAPSGMRPFEPVHGVTQTAPASPGDLLVHVRTASRGLCFELVTRVVAELRDAVRVELEVQAFRSFDNRSLLGFVEDVDNPTGAAAEVAALIGADDPEHAGGSFALVQTFLHDLTAWERLHVCEQERVMGRDKLTNTPIPAQDVDRHRLTRHQGTQPLRHDMAFGSPALGEFGTVSVAYAASPDVLEASVRRRFVGVPLGTYDPLLDFSTAVSGGLFYVPPSVQLRGLATPRGVRRAPVEVA
ncbi:Dyp-type peroxidase [Nocardioides conyzicola]|uniref:Dyp-type peroxidase n=1 Tax=Nocardioides conyzicola TaxID=1651781 RepID=A0ABP8WWD6_9ACTN